MGRYLRNFPQHERRQNALTLAPEGESVVRAKRRPNNLPTGYDDITRSDLKVRSWKHNRRNQWFRGSAR
jgi:hypothetical protein